MNQTRDTDLPDLLREAITAHEAGDNGALAQAMARASARLFELGIEDTLGADWRAEVERAENMGDLAPIIRAINSLGCCLFPNERKQTLYRVLATLTPAVRMMERDAQGASPGPLLRALQEARDQVSELVKFMDETTHPSFRAGGIQ